MDETKKLADEAQDDSVSASPAAVDRYLEVLERKAIAEEVSKSLFGDS